MATDNLTQEYPADFLAGWGGCSHLDCLPKCRTYLEGGYCERLALAWADHQTTEIPAPGYGALGGAVDRPRNPEPGSAAAPIIRRVK